MYICVYMCTHIAADQDKLNAEFAENCPLEIDMAIQAFDSPHTKAHAVAW